MKNFDSRTYSISDFLEWHRRGQLELNAKFQRRNVWNDKARSFLMDTIIRGKPIPKLFIRQQLDPRTKESTRDVVDGQQRLRTILGYLNDAFPISILHNEKFGGILFSQLDQVDPAIQTSILSYELSVDLLINLPDSEILDIFSRLNSHAVPLNEQEKLNAHYFGTFKLLADELAHMYNDYWTNNRIISPSHILRMDDVALVADLLIVMIDGIQSRKQIPQLYKKYENQFEVDPRVLKKRFGEIIQKIDETFEGKIEESEFSRVSLFYSLFAVYYHLLYGIQDAPMVPNGFLWNPHRLRNKLERIELLIKEEMPPWESEDRQFLTDSKKSTTDLATRRRRFTYILSALL